MRIETTNGQIPSQFPARSASWTLIFLAAILFLLLTIASTAFISAYFYQTQVKYFLKRSGIESARALIEALKRAPGRYVTGLMQSRDLKTIAIDIRFEHWQKLVAKRNSALAIGALLASEEDEVPANVNFDGRRYKAKIRLKGDWPDHWESKQAWSLRLSIEGDGRIFGMEKFALQHPSTRAYATEPLIMAHFRSEGVLAPAIQYSKVEVNGADWGTMMLEEHFGSELPESNGRASGVMLALDEDLFMRSLVTSRPGKIRAASDPYHNSWTTTLRAFGQKRLERKPESHRMWRLAQGLFTAFQQGRLRPSQIFDLETFARFYVIAQMWGAQHVTNWHNARFYFNPFTLKFEPIAYDNELFLTSFAFDVSHDGPIVQALLKDPEFRRVLPDVIQAVSDRLIDRGGIDHLQRLQSELSFLQAINPLVSVDLTLLKQNALALKNYDPDMFGTLGLLSESARPTSEGHFDSNLTGTFSQNGRDLRLVLGNRLHQPVELISLRKICGSGASEVGSEIPILPLRLRSTRLAQMPQWSTVNLYGVSVREGCRLHARSRIADSDRIAVDTIDGPVPYLISHPDEKARAHSLPSWMHWDATAKHYSVSSGRRNVVRPLSLPRGSSILIKAGAELVFEQGTFLHVEEGSLQILGSASRPVILRASGDGRSWNGIFVNGGRESSRLHHAHFSGLAGFDDGSRRLSGAITFRKTKLEIQSVSIMDVTAEDALNLVHVSAEINGLTISKTVSDGIDLDFSSVRVRQLELSDIGGDALDFGGSTGELQHVLAQRVKDKGLSVGEGSKVTASDLDFQDVGSGAVVKDGSQLDVERLKVKGAQIAGLMAYVKKQRFGGARLQARNVSIYDSPEQGLAQIGSQILIDGKALTSKALDVELLYRDSVMRKTPVTAR